MSLKLNQYAFALCLLPGLINVGFAKDPTAAKPVPATRAEMLKALNALKHREARLPLPPADPNAVAPAPAPAPGAPGSLGVVNNGRMRERYLPPALTYRPAPLVGAQADAQLPYDFSTELFWIVSRVNNCHYCLGHQESKLRTVGVTEQTLLDLDTDWSRFTPAQRTAFEFAKKLTFAPDAIIDQDIDALREHYADDKILEMAYLIGRYNSTNRWTDSLGIPQEDHREFQSELPEPALGLESLVAMNGFPPRKPINDYASWKSELEKQATRKPRLVAAPVVPTSTALEPHEQLLASIPAAGQAMIEQLRQARVVGTLPVMLRDQIAFVAAREDNAWYMQHVARERLLASGMTDEAIFSLGKDAGEAKSNEANDLAISFAKQLTTDPQEMTDLQIAKLTEHFTAHQVAEIVYHVGLAAMLDRLTETARLGWSDIQ